MNRVFIKDKQAISLVVLFIMGSTLVVSNGGKAGKDAWIAVFIGIIISIPVLLMYSRICYIFPNKDLYDINITLFGNYLGKIINIMYIWFSFHLGSLVLRNFGEFITNTSLNKTPKIIPMVFISILCIWGIKEGKNLLGRWAEIVLFVLIILLSITTIFLIPKENINNIRPLLNTDMNSFLKGAYSVFSFPFGETIVFLLVFSSLKNNKSSYKIFIFGLLIGGFIVLITTLSEILVLGEREYTSLFFPSYSAYSRIDIGDFIQRIEIIVAIAFIGGGFIKICMCVIGAVNGISKLFGFDYYSFIVTPIMVLMLNLSLLVYESNNEMVEWIIKYWSYYSFPFQIVLPIIILVASEFRIRKLNGGVKIE